MRPRTKSVVCCGSVVEWKLAWTDEDGEWYEKTCPTCGCKHTLKCLLSDATKEELGLVIPSSYPSSERPKGKEAEGDEHTGNV